MSLGFTACARPGESTGNDLPASAAAQARGGDGPRASASFLPAEAAALLAEIKAADKELLSISEEDGRFLQSLIAATGATRALEIGGASGYSAIWMGLALRHTGGRLTTIEYDAGRAKALAANIERAGLSDIVTAVAGDAFEEIPRVPGEFDFVFVDAWKPDYKRYYDMVLPRLRPRGLLLAHNVLNKKDEMADFLHAIATDRNVVTSIVAPSGEGISVTVKILGDAGL